MGSSTWNERCEPSLAIAEAPRTSVLAGIMLQTRSHQSDGSDPPNAQKILDCDLGSRTFVTTADTMISDANL